MYILTETMDICIIRMTDNPALCNVGLKTEPWGTPLNTPSHIEKAVLSFSFDGEKRDSFASKLGPDHLSHRILSFF